MGHGMAIGGSGGVSQRGERMNAILPASRRDLFKGAAGTTAALSLGGFFGNMMLSQQALASTNANGEQTAAVPSPYGPLAPVKDLATGLPLLQLPKGFRYRTFGWTNDIMSDGQPVPNNHDGMGVALVRGRGGSEHVLIRNHEVRDGTRARNTVVGNPLADFDPARAANGGCSVLRMVNGRMVDQRMSIAGTIVNCAGGLTSWGTWITNEETVAGSDNNVAYSDFHGYNFEVSTDPMQTRATPIRDMGRFAHEAVARDPVTGYFYQTEDARNIALFYRYKPNNTAQAYGALAMGGVLEAAKVVGIDKANLIAVNGVRSTHVNNVGQSFMIEWVRIDTPDAAPARYTENEAGNPAPIIPSASNPTAPNVSGPFKQGREAGALRISRGEGIWWSNRDDGCYICDTSFGYNSGGGAGRGWGCVWFYRPDRSNPARGTLTLVYAAANIQAGNNPDNITISPRGGLLTCDDGSGVVDEFGFGHRLMGYTAAGLAYIFAKNNVQLSDADIASMGRTGQFPAEDYRDSETAGVCFDPSGRTLYVNVFSPGFTAAITGPWARGNL